MRSSIRNNIQAAKNMKNNPIVIERTYSAPISRVWKATTDKNDMKHWYFDLTEFRPEVGFEFQFYGGTEEKKYLHLCRITEVVVGKKSRIVGATTAMRDLLWSPLSCMK
jgi:uncharacterized protein YndB with AHSA1/START domain